jgi:hypothetical protein
MLSSKMTVLAALMTIALPASAQTLLFRVSGVNPNDYLAESVAMVGDFNHDGYDDFIVGAKFDDSNGDNAGIARVYSGKDASVLLSVTGSDPGDWMGVAVAGAGDVNKDGFADVIIGASGNDPNGTNSGSAYVYSGKTGALLRTFNGFDDFDHFGQAVAGAGDVDGDGAADLMVGSPQEGNGTARVYSGSTGSIIWTFTGIAAGDAFGDAVNGSGDVNSDGFADLIVGAPYGDLGAVDNGYAQVYSGRTGVLIWTLAGGSGDHMGASVDGAGDFNDDGFDDFIIGSPLDEPNGAESGSAFIRSGFNAALLASYSGGAAGYHLGAAVAGAGNAGGHGLPTVIIGAPDQAGGTVFVHDSAGLVYSFAGADRYGAAVDGGGDLDKDGRADFIVGDPARDLGGANTGRAYAYISSVEWASRSTYGAGWPGSLGVPDLTASGAPVLCSTITLSLENSRGVATAGVMFLGLSSAFIPTALGGTLLLVPHTTVPVTVPALGLSLPLPVVCDSELAGLAIYLQALEVDPGASQGVSFTPGLQLVLGGTSPY